jgi:predicted metalloprotease with PDZ domain
MVIFLTERKFMVSKCIVSLSIILVLMTSFSSLSANEITEKKVELDHIKINYHFSDKSSIQKEPEITELVSQAFAVYAELFGGLPRDLSGTEYSEISIHVKQGKHLGGEADPKLIILTWSEGNMFGYGDWRTLLLHEVFHLWSAESLRYKDGREHWFNEGFTEYYAFKTAVQFGLISAEEAISTAAFPVGYYSASKGLGEISMREAGKSNKTKFDNYFLIYHGGWVVAMILDQEIRSKTNGTKSLDDLMAFLYENYPRDKNLYGIDDISLSLKKVTGLNFSNFLSKYVDGVQTIPISKYLHLSDALWSYKFNEHNKSKYKYLYQTLGITSIEQKQN